MPTLYTMPGTCSLAPNIAVAWEGADIKIHNLKRGEHKEADYLAINPRGQVPAVKFNDGDVLTEAVAILHWIGGLNADDGFEADSALARKELEALSYMSSEVHATYGPHFAPQGFAESDPAQDEVKEKTYAKLADHYTRMDETLAASDGDWYLGHRSFADAYLYVLTRWIDMTPLSISNFPSLEAHRDMMDRDEGVQTALSRQNMKPINP
ncbi:glutathione S-transferase N-terminal domain-containing protein [Gymnodinialimonas hymeniacidonis]|uniref:glutathione S-transferase N-terminal domain-containing protein n=1 Tax=Gymnodinialimonas hymeniacidonis TaxID=3126508 RepID=UPI0034C5C63A